MRVLVVEDEQRLVRLLKRVLEEERYVVDVAVDGDEAIEKAGYGDYDLMVLDVMLPRRSGVEVCRWLRRNGIKTPILLLTARDQLEDKVMGLDAGADDYLTKPFAFEELLARLRALGRRAQDTLLEQILQVSDLALDLNRHEVRRAGQLIPLTTREFALLEYLMRHRGQALSRAQITRQVWPDDSEAVSNVVDIYIHYLRDKIDQGFEPKLIHTIRGVGYSLRG
ncbi:MAG TPA: response regulator transcription factor [Ktedonobacterales bacterium]|nr:response regulator transcription factor [Ktedonobacterales bacterium]